MEFSWVSESACSQSQSHPSRDGESNWFLLIATLLSQRNKNQNEHSSLQKCSSLHRTYTTNAEMLLLPGAECCCYCLRFHKHLQNVITLNDANNVLDACLQSAQIGLLIRCVPPMFGLFSAFDVAEIYHIRVVASKQLQHTAPFLCTEDGGFSRAVRTRP